MLIVMMTPERLNDIYELGQSVHVIFDESFFNILLSLRYYSFVIYLQIPLFRFHVIGQSFRKFGGQILILLLNSETQNLKASLK